MTLLHSDMIAKVPGNDNNHITDIIMSHCPLASVTTLEDMNSLWLKRCPAKTSGLAQMQGGEDQRKGAWRL